LAREEATCGGIWTKANAALFSAGPQADSIAAVSLLSHCATDSSTQSGILVELGPAVMPPTKASINHFTLIAGVDGTAGIKEP